MSNIHGLGDYQSINDRSRNQMVPYQFQNSNANQRGNAGGAQAMSRNVMVFVPQQQDAQNIQPSDPHKESFFTMLHWVFFSNFRFLSFCCLVTITNLIMFIVSLAYDGIDIGTPQQPSSLLQVPYYTLIDLGGINQPRLKSGQVWRLIAAEFLHLNFEHIFVNTFSIIVAVSYFEREYGPFIIGFVYLISGIGGNIFEACVDTWNGYRVSAGASTGITGIIGLFLAEMIVNWSALGRMMGPDVRCMLCCCRIMQVMFLSLMAGANISLQPRGSDNLQVSSSAHFGGFLTGFLVTLWVLKPIEESKHTKWTRYIGLGFTGLFFLLCFVLFYTVKNE